MQNPLSDIRTHFEDRGNREGATVLFLHGNPDSARLWEPILERLPDGPYRYLAPDLPGFGRSTADRPYAEGLASAPLETMAAWVDDVLDRAQAKDPIHLVMHDFGGPFGFSWAVRNPRRVRSLTGIDTLFFSTYRWHFWARVWRTPLLGEACLPLFGWRVFCWEVRRGSPGMLESELRRTWEFVTPEMKRRVLELYRATDPEVFVGWEKALRQLMADRPSLAIWGSDDPYIAPEWAHRLGARRVEILAGIGHWPPLEAPDIVAAHLKQLFASSGDPGAAREED